MNILEKVIQDLELYGFSVIQDVIESTELEKISNLFEQDFQPARVGKSNGPQREESIRGDSTFWLDPQDPPSELSNVVGLIHEMKNGFNQHFFMGIKDFECHLAKYPTGSFYKKHLDRFEDDSSRSISFIFYLHQEWTHQNGGELILYSTNNEIMEMILPRPGSMVVFLSEKFPHEVKVCLKERRSLTGWMHTKLLT